MFILVFLLGQLIDPGYLTVKADQDSLPVFVDDDYVGKTPLIKYTLKPDEYNVGFFPQDSIEAASWRFKDGNIGALWKIAKYSEGIVKVRIASDRVTVVELNYAKVKQAPGKAKLKVGGCLAAACFVGALITLAVQAIF